MSDVLNKIFMRKHGMLAVRVGRNAQKRSALFVRLRFARFLLRQFPLIYKQLLLLLYFQIQIIIISSETIWGTGFARGHKDNGCDFKKEFVSMLKSVQRCLYVCVLLDCCYVSFRWFTNNCYYFCIACGFKDLVTSERTVGKVFQLLTRY